MSLSPVGNSHVDFNWSTAGMTSVPYQIFFDPAVYRREQERIFRGPTWSYVGLEAEVASPGDFKSTFIGDTPIVVSRDKEGILHAFVNRCAHRGAMVCRESRGNKASHTCIYHQWSYNQKGDLIGVPFRKGINHQGGYPADFDPAQHSLQKLQVDTYKGLIFASFSSEVEPLFDYLGPAMRPWLDRVFNRPVQVLGYTRQFTHANWKLYTENVKDPYHASLLHLFLTTFGLYRSSQGGGITMDETGRHSIVRAYRKTEQEETAAYRGKNMHSYQKDYALADPSLLASRQEFDIDLNVQIQTIFPSLVVQQIQNTLATRQILPKGPDRFELVFTFFGFEEDDEEMRRIRIKQANLAGPAGYVSMEDGYATELVQQAIVREKDECSMIELGGTGTEDQENLITETALRGYWNYYHDVMGFS